MAKPLEEFGDWTFGQLAAVGHALGGPKAARQFVGNNDLRKQVADLIANALKTGASTVATQPTEMTIGGRVYEIFSFLKEGEDNVIGKTMVMRAKQMKANLGEKDCRFIMEHQSDIPAELRGRVVFVFTDWRLPDDSVHVAYVTWDGGRWLQIWGWLGREWNGSGRVLRRK